MKRVILALAAECQSRKDLWAHARTTYADVVEYVDLPPACTTPAQKQAWFARQSAVDHIVIVFGTSGAAVELPPTPAAAESASLLTPGASVEAEAETAGAASPPEQPPGEGTPVLVLDAHERSSRPHKPELSVVIFDPADRTKLSPDLQRVRSFDITSRDGDEALICRFMHERVLRGHRHGHGVAAKAFLKLIAGIIALLVGLYSKADEILVDTLGELAAQYVHYCIAAAVLLLISTGIVAVVRLIPHFLRDLLSEEVIRRLTLGRRWQYISIAAGFISIGIVAIYFLPKHPSLEAIVTEQARKWATLLDESYYHDGGIKEHHNNGPAQVWISSQAVCGMLAVAPRYVAHTDKLRAVYIFIDRAQIAPLQLLPNAKESLPKSLPDRFAGANFAIFPDRFPTFAMAVDAIEFAGGGAPLAPLEVQKLESQKDHLFTISSSSEGWGYFEQWEWGVTEIASWVCLAEVASLRAHNPAVWDPTGQARCRQRIREVAELIRKRQIPDLGAFSPISNLPAKPEFARTYTTTMALWALAEATAPDLALYQEAEIEPFHQVILEGVRWLDLNITEELAGWKENPKNPADEPMLGLDGQTVFVLGRCSAAVPLPQRSLDHFGVVKRRILRDAPKWIRRPMTSKENGSIHDADRYLRGTDRVIEESTILWYPWAVAAMRSMASDPQLSADENRQAEKYYRKLAARSAQFTDWVMPPAASNKSPRSPARPEGTQYNYVPSEALVGFFWPASSKKP
jgi:hypothetical protein